MSIYCQCLYCTRNLFYSFVVKNSHLLFLPLDSGIIYTKLFKCAFYDVMPTSMQLNGSIENPKARPARIIKHFSGSMGERNRATHEKAVPQYYAKWSRVSRLSIF
jgi:hypothetical protein